MDKKDSQDGEFVVEKLFFNLAHLKDYRHTKYVSYIFSLECYNVYSLSSLS